MNGRCGERTTCKAAVLLNQVIPPINSLPHHRTAVPGRGCRWAALGRRRD